MEEDLLEMLGGPMDEFLIERSDVWLGWNPFCWFWLEFVAGCSLEWFLKMACL